MCCGRWNNEGGDVKEEMEEMEEACDPVYGVREILSRRHSTSPHSLTQHSVSFFPLLLVLFLSLLNAMVGLTTVITEWCCKG